MVEYESLCRFQAVESLKECIETMKAEGRLPKILVFSQWRRVLDLFRIHLEVNESDDFTTDMISEITGEVPVNNRNKNLATFGDSALPGTTLLVTTSCAAEGLNITAANIVLFLSLTYTPKNEEQALCRAFRIGQIGTVIVLFSSTPECGAEQKLGVRRAKKHRHSSIVVDAKHLGLHPLYSHTEDTRDIGPLFLPLPERYEDMSLAELDEEATKVHHGDMAAFRYQLEEEEPEPEDESETYDFAVTFHQPQ